MHIYNLSPKSLVTFHHAFSDKVRTKRVTRKKKKNYPEKKIIELSSKYMVGKLDKHVN